MIYSFISMLLFVESDVRLSDFSKRSPLRKASSAVARTG